MDNEEAVRLYLHDKLTIAFPNLTVYYRPPGNLLLTKPCIVYTQLRTEMSYANNSPYVMGVQYQVSVLSNLPGISTVGMYSLNGIIVERNTAYVQEDVVHDIFTVTIKSI